MKVIRSGEKGFKEAKAKMFEPIGLTKKEQLEKVFKTILESFGINDGLDNLVNILIREVTIRTKL